VEQLPEREDKPALLEQVLKAIAERKVVFMVNG